MNEIILDIARKYQKASFRGLPFSGTDEEMLSALEKSWEKDAKIIRNLRKNDNLVRKLISEYDMGL